MIYSWHYFPFSEPNPRLRARVGRWGHGSYTLIRDSDAEEQESALDATLFVCVSDKWTEDLGGYNSYISKDEDAEVIMVCGMLGVTRGMRICKAVIASSVRICLKV